MNTILETKSASAGIRRPRPDTRTLVALLLVLVTTAVYAQVGSFDWTNLEDRLNITRNPFVQGPVTLEKIVWAFTDGTWVTNYWVPLLWLSFLFDYQMWGLNPGGYHLTNLLLHIANTLLLFSALRKMTRALWPSALVAALFALHPLHVESVAWITERKDVLSGFFWMMTMLLYGRYVEKPSAGRYVCICLAFVCGLMAKPMLVTLPFALLLLDLWPLERWQPGTSLKTAWALVREKLPFFILVAAAGTAAFITQNREGVVAPLESISLAVRLQNVLVGYVGYLGKTFWPHSLAVLYPHPGRLPLWQTLPAAILLAVVTILALVSVRKRPWLTVGWFWYLGTLVPVIGWVVIGPHAVADRYTYIPLIGIFVIVAWGADDLLPRGRIWRQVMATAATVLLLVLAGLTYRQTGYWVNSRVLFERALANTKGNYLMHNNLGVTLAEAGEWEAAMAHYRRALEIYPAYAEAYNNIGEALLVHGDLAGAGECFQQALKFSTALAAPHYNLGIVRAQQERPAEAEAHYRQALKIQPDDPRTHNNLGVVLQQQGRIGEAESHFRRALQIFPQYAGARQNLDRLVGKGRPAAGP